MLYKMFQLIVEVVLTCEYTYVKNYHNFSVLYNVHFIYINSEVDLWAPNFFQNLKKVAQITFYPRSTAKN